MAIKYFCDCCEIQIERHIPVNIMRHIFDELNEEMTLLEKLNRRVVRKEGDEFLPYSGIDKELQLCLKCYNELFKSFASNFKLLKSRIGPIEKYIKVNLDSFYDLLAILDGNMIKKSKLNKADLELLNFQIENAKLSLEQIKKII